MVKKTPEKAAAIPADLPADAKVLFKASPNASSEVNRRCRRASGQTVQKLLAGFYFGAPDGKSRRYRVGDLRYDLGAGRLVLEPASGKATKAKLKVAKVKVKASKAAPKERGSQPALKRPATAEASEKRGGQPVLKRPAAAEPVGAPAAKKPVSSRAAPAAAPGDLPPDATVRCCVAESSAVAKPAIQANLERCRQADGRTVEELLASFTYKDAQGTFRPYTRGDLKYDISLGRLTLERAAKAKAKAKAAPKARAQTDFPDFGLEA